ncbi:monocarboxylate transporter 7-like [Diadema setosum]|uniref:monocarboxylate transporter 7-like n=1 Tax=Diadema setosum TaxID=31175 RepID=UPI003B3B9756
MSCHESLKSSIKSKWGWIAAVASSLVFTVIKGYMYSYGLIMVELMEEFGSSATKTGYVGTLSYGMMCTMCLITSPLSVKMGYRLAACLGATLCVLASFSTSFAPSLSVMFFSYSCLYGMGCSFLLCAGINATAGYFPTKHRSIALGIASAGANIGVLVINPLVYALISRFGWRGMMRIMAAVVGGTVYPCAFTFVSKASVEGQADEKENGRPHSNNNAKSMQEGCYRKLKPRICLPNTECEVSSCEGADEMTNDTAPKYHSGTNNATNIIPGTNFSVQHIPNIISQDQCQPFIHRNDTLRHPQPCMNGDIWCSKGDYNGQVLSHAASPSTEDSKKQPTKARKWQDSLSIVCMPESWLIEFGLLMGAVALSFAYFSSVNLTVTSGYSKKTGSLIMATMGLSEVIGKIILGVMADRLPIPKIFIVMAGNCVGALLMVVASQVPNSKAYLFFQATVQGIFVMAALDSMPHSMGDQIFGEKYRVQVWAENMVFMGIGGVFGAVFGESVDKTGSYQMAYYGNMCLFLISTALLAFGIVYQRFCARDRFILFQTVGRRYVAVSQNETDKMKCPCPESCQQDHVVLKMKHHEIEATSNLVVEKTSVV